jgi:hypothetical protein
MAICESSLSHSREGSELSRRTLFRGTVGTAALLIMLESQRNLAGAAVESQPESAGVERIEQLLATLSQSPELDEIQERLIAFITTSPFTNWISNTLKANGAAMTGFQRDVLQAFVDAVQHPSNIRHLAAAVSGGGKLTQRDRTALLRLKTSLDSHPSVSVLRAAGAQLKTSNQLPTKISAFISTLSSSQPGTSQDALVSSIAQKISGIANSQGYRSVLSKFLSIMQDPDFPSYLQSVDAPPQLLASLIPQVTLVGLQLPLGDNPDQFELVVLAAVGALLYFDMITVAGIVAVAVIAAQVAIAFLAVAVTLAVAGLFVSANAAEAAGLDCDGDGDPGDASEPSECP